MRTQIAGAARHVAQISNLPYRRFSIGQARNLPWALDSSNALQNEILRYGRLKICATTGRPRPRQVRFGPVLFALLLVMGLLWLAGCASPISTVPTSPRIAYGQEIASALNGNQYSTGTRLVLRRYGLEEQFESAPAETLLQLHQTAGSDERRDLLCALAELNYLHAVRLEREVKPWVPKNTGDYYLASTLYAWLYLFADTNGIAAQPFDPRIRLAADLYNYALAKAFIRRGDTNRVIQISGGPRHVPQGPVTVELNTARFPWPLAEFDRFLAADDFKVRGLSMRNRDPGLGSPLIGQKKPTPESSIASRVPVTLFLRGPNRVQGWGTNPVSVSLELHSAFDPAFAEVAGRRIPLRTDTTAPLAHTLGSVSVWDLDFARFFSTRETIKSGIYLTQPYQPGRVPVMLVHGTASSPLWWGEMLNTLRSDTVLRERCQFWIYAYNTGLPVSLSGANLRDAISNMVQRLDPTVADPALRQMVVVGHSQGGLLAKMTVTESGDKLWSVVSDRPLDQLTLRPKQHEFLQRVLFYKPVPAVTRVVFICTPHRGSFRATSFVRNLAAKLISLPSLLVFSPEEETALRKELRLPPEARLATPTSLEGMSPKNPILLALAEIPPAPGVTAHSIIAAKDPTEVPDANDGIVEYRSAHVTYVESELIVRSGHTCQDKPVTIEEVRRIVLKHLNSLPARNP